MSSEQWGAAATVGSIESQQTQIPLEEVFKSGLDQILVFRLMDRKSSSYPISFGNPSFPDDGSVVFKATEPKGDYVAMLGDGDSELDTSTLVPVEILQNQGSDCKIAPPEGMRFSDVRVEAENETETSDKPESKITKEEAEQAFHACIEQFLALYQQDDQDSELLRVVNATVAQANKTINGKAGQKGKVEGLFQATDSIVPFYNVRTKMELTSKELIRHLGCFPQETKVVSTQPKVTVEFVNDDGEVQGHLTLSFEQRSYPGKLNGRFQNVSVHVLSVQDSRMPDEEAKEYFVTDLQDVQLFQKPMQETTT